MAIERPQSYMIPEEMSKAIEERCHIERVTQDEIVRRAVAEYLAKKPAESTFEHVPRDIKTHLAHRDEIL